MQNLANTERDRDDAISEANQLKRNLNEVIDAHNRTEQRLLQLQKCLTESEEGNFEFTFFFVNNENTVSDRTVIVVFIVNFGFLIRGKSFGEYSKISRISDLRAVYNF